MRTLSQIGQVLSHKKMTEISKNFFYSNVIKVTLFFKFFKLSFLLLQILLGLVDEYCNHITHLLVIEILP